MINFLHTFHPDPILISLGPVNIYWYSVLIIVSLILGFLVVFKLGDHYQIKKEQIIDLGFYLIIFGIIGARLYHVLLEINYYWQNPLDIFKVWQGGLAIHGAIIAGIIVLITYAKKKQQSFWFWADLIAPALILGQAIGRWGNYFNQELFGKPTDLSWGIPIDFANRVEPYLTESYFHPTFLYESILNFLIFSLLIFLHYLNPLEASRRDGLSVDRKHGVIFLIYLISYSLVRFLMEFLRTDLTFILWGLRLPQLVSLLIIIFSVFLIVRKDF